MQILYSQRWFSFRHNTFAVAHGTLTPRLNARKYLRAKRTAVVGSSLQNPFRQLRIRPEPVLDLPIIEISKETAVTSKISSEFSVDHGVSFEMN
jgi:hypothetical protein